VPETLGGFGTRYRGERDYRKDGSYMMMTFSDPNASKQSGVGKVVVRPVFFAVVLLLLAGGFAIRRYAQNQSEPVSQPLSAPPATEDSGEQEPLAVSSTGADPASAGAGTLKIFIPRMAGDDYWIYLNGHLVSAPPHGVPTGESDFVYVAVKSGWEIWDQKGLRLTMSNESFRGLDEFLNSGGNAAQQFFQPVVMKLDAADYTVEVVMSSEHKFYGPGESSFPFVVTRKYETSVRGGDTEQVYIAVPDNYLSGVAAAAAINRACPGGSAAAPDLDWLQKTMNEYGADPMVRALQRAAATQGSQSQNVVMLDLPSSQGGPREFDRNQIGRIVSVIAANHRLPSHGDVAACMDKAPQFSRAYTQYDRLLTVVDQEMESFRKLAE
jgi:hypothetical protein